VCKEEKMCVKNLLSTSPSSSSALQLTDIVSNEWSNFRNVLLKKAGACCGGTLIKACQILFPPNCVWLGSVCSSLFAQVCYLILATHGKEEAIILLDSCESIKVDTSVLRFMAP
jgi:hypothetical protein